MKKDKAENVIKYYVLCNKLKDIVRTGWKDWKVKRDRVESIAEHIYSVQMLAIAMAKEYEYDIDLQKVILMLSVHEIEEIMIGDITLFDSRYKDKAKLGHLAVEKILANILNGKDIANLIYEFDERKTKEAIFAFFCDKLEADLQARLYDLENVVDLKAIGEDNVQMKSEQVKNLFSQGLSWGEMWIKFGQERYGYDKNFLEVSNFAFNNDILKYKK